ADRVFRKTVDAALSLHPGTRQVLVIVGTPERDQKLEGDVRAELDDLESRVAIQYLSDLSLSDLMNGIKSARPQSLIFPVRQSPDEPANALDPYDMLGLVAGWSHVPVYSMSGGMLGRGSVGGYSADVEAAGAMVGRLALQIADGARPPEIAIRTVPSTAMFDARQLQRWGISDDRLPAGSTVMFREPSLLREYRKYVLGAVAIFAVQLALIGGLLVQRIRRRRAEKSLRRSEA